MVFTSNYLTFLSTIFVFQKIFQIINREFNILIYWFFHYTCTRPSNFINIIHILSLDSIRQLFNALYS